MVGQMNFVKQSSFTYLNSISATFGIWHHIVDKSSWNITTLDFRAEDRPLRNLMSRTRIVRRSGKGLAMETASKMSYHIMLALSE